MSEPNLFLRAIAVHGYFFLSFLLLCIGTSPNQVDITLGKKGDAQAQSTIYSCVPSVSPFIVLMIMQGVCRLNVVDGSNITQLLCLLIVAIDVKRAG